MDDIKCGGCARNLSVKSSRNLSSIRSLVQIVLLVLAVQGDQGDVRSMQLRRLPIVGTPGHVLAEVVQLALLLLTARGLDIVSNILFQLQISVQVAAEILEIRCKKNDQGF